MSLNRPKEVFQNELLNMSNAQRIEDPTRKKGCLFDFLSPKTSLEEPIIQIRFHVSTTIWGSSPKYPAKLAISGMLGQLSDDHSTLPILWLRAESG